MLVPIIVPRELMPCKIPGFECECQNRPVDTAAESLMVFWNAEEGDPVEEGDTLCSFEVQKRVLEIHAPCTGILREICYEDESIVGYQDILGYILRQE